MDHVADQTPTGPGDAGRRARPRARRTVATQRTPRPGRSRASRSGRGARSTSRTTSASEPDAGDRTSSPTWRRRGTVVRPLDRRRAATSRGSPRSGEHVGRAERHDGDRNALTGESASTSRSVPSPPIEIPGPCRRRNWATRACASPRARVGARPTRQYVRARTLARDDFAAAAAGDQVGDDQRATEGHGGVRRAQALSPVGSRAAVNRVRYLAAGGSQGPPTSALGRRTCAGGHAARGVRGLLPVARVVGARALLDRSHAPPRAAHGLRARGLFGRRATCRPGIRAS